MEEGEFQTLVTDGYADLELDWTLYEVVFEEIEGGHRLTFVELEIVNEGEEDEALVPTGESEEWDSV